MTLSIEVIVGNAPAGSLRIADYQEPDDLAAEARKRLEGSGTLDVEFKLARSRSRGTPAASEPEPTIPDFYGAIRDAVSGVAAGRLRCHVASEGVKNRLDGMARAKAGVVNRYRCGGWDVELCCGDVTAVSADAVVNASNMRLKLGGGVSRALGIACGPQLQLAMDRIGSIPWEGIAETGAFNLKTAQRILHVPTAGGTRDVVAKAVENVLSRCRTTPLASVAVPALGTGTGGLPIADFAEICVVGLKSAAAPPRGCKVILVMWTGKDFIALEHAFDRAEGFLHVKDPQG